MTIKSVATTIALFGVLSACGGGSSSSSGDPSENPENNSNPSPFSTPGNVRILREETVATDGDMFTRTYGYDGNGRLTGVSIVANGDLTTTRTFGYDQSGRLLTRLDDRVSEDSRDVLREYQYDGNRATGFYSSFVGEPVDVVVQYQYSGDQIVSSEERLLDPPVEDPMLTDGTIIETGSFVYNDAGFLTSIENRDVDGVNGVSFLFEVGQDGARTSIQAFDLESNLLSTTTVFYEDGTCLEVALGSIAQWVCLQ